MSAQLPEIRSAPNPPLWRDVRVLRWGGQIAVVGVVVWFLWTIVDNGITNLESSGLSTTFDFLSQQFRAAIPGIEDAADLTIAQAFWVGYVNTLRVILIGIPACTIIGIAIGIARLSDNLMVRAVGTLYVELFRNIPVLLWIFFTTTVYLLENLPSRQDPLVAGPFVLSNGLSGIPWLNPSANGVILLATIATGVIVTVGVLRWRRGVNEATGEPARGGLYGAATMVVFLVLAHFVSGNAFALDTPELFIRDNGIPGLEGGIELSIPWLGLTTALTLYTASHVAEIVRGAIQAIPKGQSEAANAVALTTYQRYRFVILPQAFRIMIPPLASQYLNITKNSSLAVAVSYIEITSVFQRIVNNATPALQGVVILMGLYLTFSLSISLIANFFNRRLALESR